MKLLYAKYVQISSIIPDIKICFMTVIVTQEGYDNVF
jgi:hypothetical protein